MGVMHVMPYRLFSYFQLVIAAMDAEPGKRKEYFVGGRGHEYTGPISAATYKQG